PARDEYRREQAGSRARQLENLRRERGRLPPRAEPHARETNAEERAPPLVYEPPERLRAAALDRIEDIPGCVAGILERGGQLCVRRLRAGRRVEPEHELAGAVQLVLESGQRLHRLVDRLGVRSDRLETHERSGQAAPQARQRNG